MGYVYNSVMNEQEFETIYRSMAPRLFRRAMIALGVEEEANDITQHAFLSLWEHRDAVDAPEAWLNTQVSRAIIDRYRTYPAQERFNRLYPIELEGASEINEDRLEQIRAFVKDELTEATRRVVELVFYQGLSYREASATLNVSQSAINKHVVIALKSLRNRFNAL